MAHRLSVFAVACGFAFRRRGHGYNRRGKIRARNRREARAKLLAQNRRTHLLYLTFLQFAELKRTERHANEARDRESEGGEYVAHLAVLAFANRESEPDIRTLHALDAGFDGAVADAADSNAGAQGVELLLRPRAMGAHAIAAEPAG